MLKCDLKLKTLNGGSHIKAVLLKPGDRYGQPQQDGVRPLLVKNWMVEFYDSRYPFDERGGQFITSYFLCTLQGIPRGRGLNLHWPDQDWSLDGDSVAALMAWCRGAVQASKTPA